MYFCKLWHKKYRPCAGGFFQLPEVWGYLFAFKGATQGIRNPDAHEQFRPLDEEEGFEKLAFASMLMRRLDQAKLRPAP